MDVAQQNSVDALVRVLRDRMYDMSAAEPKDIADAVRQISLLRERLADASRTAGATYARITKLEDEVARYRQGYEALREVLGAFGEETPGWHRSVLVCDEDFRGWQADAGL